MNTSDSELDGVEETTPSKTDDHDTTGGVVGVVPKVSDQEEVEVERPLFEPTTVKVEITPQNNHTKPLGKNKTLGAIGDAIAIVRETQSTLAAAIGHWDKLFSSLAQQNESVITEMRRNNQPVTDKDGNLYIRLLGNIGMNRAMLDSDVHMGAINREGASWVQGVEHEGNLLMPGIPKQRLKGDQYTREELMSYITRKAGVGNTADVPLWHSGIWMRFRAPSLAGLTTLFQEVDNLKVNIGRETRGLAFSNVTHYVKNLVLDFAFLHCIQANVEFKTPSDLKEYVDVRDIPGIILGIAGTLYPNGYQYAWPCIADPSMCTHIETDMVSPLTFWWCDSNSLSNWQRQHMSKRINQQAPRKFEDLERYRSEHTRGSERVVLFGDTGVILKCPTVFEHEAVGRTWINSIIEMTSGVFNEPPEGMNRSAFIKELADTTAAREYAHWVKAIIEYDEDTECGYNIISEERDIIDETLSNVFSTSEYYEQFSTAVEKYIDDSIIAISAMTSWNCPHCNTPQAIKFKERFENLVTIDPLNEFFTLGIRKVNQ